jgi:intracellular multiplication protein IcmK
MKNTPKMMIGLTALMLIITAFPVLAQQDILSRYDSQTGRDLAPAGDPPATGSGPGAGAQAPALVDPLTNGADMNPLRIEGFNKSIEQIFLMTPEMIQRYRKIYEDQQSAMLERPEPEALSTTGLVSLDPGEAPPIIYVSPSVASVIGFYDATGAAWPINQFVVGDGNGFQTVRLGENSNNLTISPSKRIGHTNIVALLQGEDKPVTLRIRVSETQVNYRHDIQVMRVGPNAELNNAVSRPSQTVEQAGNSLLLATLSGVNVPADAVPVGVDGVDARAWAHDGSVFIRSRHALLSPSWTESMSGPDGVRVYRINASSVALFSVEGRIVRAELKLP